MQNHRRYEGARLIATTTTRLHIHLVQTLRTPHIACVRPRAELTETSIAVNQSMNDSVEHSVNHPINLSIKHSGTHSSNLSVRHFVDHSVNHSVDLSVDHSALHSLNH